MPGSAEGDEKTLWKFLDRQGPPGREIGFKRVECAGAAQLADLQHRTAAPVLHAIGRLSCRTSSSHHIVTVEATWRPVAANIITVDVAIVLHR